MEMLSAGVRNALVLSGRRFSFRLTPTRCAWREIGCATAAVDRDSCPTPSKSSPVWHYDFCFSYDTHIRDIFFCQCPERKGLTFQLMVVNEIINFPCYGSTPCQLGGWHLPLGTDLLGAYIALFDKQKRTFHVPSEVLGC